MKIIVIEGLDKSGKYTQSNMLTERLMQEGYHVIKSEFHRYDQPTGKLIMQWLRKEWNVSQPTIELIMAADKQAQQEWFNELENNGYDFLILDRYTLSQAVYAVCSGMDSKWVYSLQHYLRKPDLDIVIDIPAEVSIQRKGKYGENDRYESDLKFLQRVREVFIHSSTAFSAPVKKIIDGTRDIQEVHTDIYNVVKEVFNI